MNLIEEIRKSLFEFLAYNTYINVTMLEIKQYTFKLPWPVSPYSMTFL